MQNQMKQGARKGERMMKRAFVHPPLEIREMLLKTTFQEEDVL